MYDGREVCEQFVGGLGGGLFGGFGGIGSTGIGAAGIRGGLIAGGGGGAAAGSIGPLLTLEAVFGTGFTAQSIADAIRVSEQEARFDAETGALTTIIDIATSPEGVSIVLNVARGIFEIFSASGRKLGGGPTPEAAFEAVTGGPGRQQRIAELTEPAVTGFAAPPPVQGPVAGGDFGELLRTILGALGQLGGRSTIPGLEPVAIGGTVNVPVVRGSTADPTGTLRPTVQPLPGRRRLTPLEELARQAQQPQPAPGPPARAAGTLPLRAAETLLQIILQIRAERALKDAQRRQRELIAQQLAAIRRIRMGFGQNGVSLGLSAGGAGGRVQEAGFGSQILDILIGLGTNISADLLTRLNVGGGNGEVAETQGPNGDIEALLRAAGGGSAATQCGLFRGAGGVRMSSRPASVVCLPDPITGEARFFGHLGRPLVFQRDVTMAKQIPKLIRKLGGHTQHRSKR